MDFKGKGSFCKTCLLCKVMEYTHNFNEGEIRSWNDCQLRMMYQVGQNKTRYTRFVWESRIWYHEMLYWSFIHSIWLPSNILPLLRPLFWVLWAGHLHTDCVHVASAPLLTSVMSPLQMGQTVKGIFVLSMRHKQRLLQRNDLLMNEFKSHLS